MEKENIFGVISNIMMVNGWMVIIMDLDIYI